MHIISKNIKALRLERGWTQQEMADILFVTRQTVSNWENGKALLDVETLLQIAEKLDIDVNELVYGKNEKQNVFNKEVIKTLIYLLISVIVYLISRKVARYNQWPDLFAITIRWVPYLTLLPLILFFSGVLIIQILKLTNVIKKLNGSKYHKHYKTLLILMYTLCFAACFDIVRLDIIYIMYTFKIGQFKNATRYSSMDYALNIPIWLEKILNIPIFIICSGSTFHRPPYYLIIIVLGMLYELLKPYHGKEKYNNTGK